jgi:hypothetical protein
METTTYLLKRIKLSTPKRKEERRMDGISNSYDVFLVPLSPSLRNLDFN